jgi:hypothetical protein
MQRDISLYKYRSSDSGVFVDFVNQADTETNDLGNAYLYDYMENFSCYAPVNVTRDYNTFLQMTSQASNNGSILSSSGTYTLGSGSTDFERVYNGSDEGKELLEEIWDILVTWGYTEEQAAAVLGNMAQESSYQPSLVNYIGASGLCQWLNGRFTRLSDFAGSLGKEWTDVEAQANFICMEISGTARYSQADYQWSGHETEKETFFGSGSIEDLTVAFRRGIERCGEGEANDTRRISNANAAYEILAGRTPTHQALDIEPEGGESGTALVTTDTSTITRNMTEADKKAFNTFYHAIDDLYSGDFHLEYTYNPVGESDVNNTLLLANSYINGTTLSEERLNTVDALWKADYLTDLSEKKKTVASVYGVASGEFLWPLDSEHNTSTSVFGPRVRDNGTRENHNGTDFGASANGNVYAVCDGTVTKAYYSSSGGNMVEITTELDGHTLRLIFMHNNRLLVSEGDTVSKGEVIALAGSTGDSTGVHCHLRLYVDEVATNPLLYLYGSLTQIPAIDSSGNLTYIDVISNPGSWSTAAGTEWNTYITIDGNGNAVRYQN